MTIRRQMLQSLKRHRTRLPKRKTPATRVTTLPRRKEIRTNLHPKVGKKKTETINQGVPGTINAIDAREGKRTEARIEILTTTTGKTPASQTRASRITTTANRKRPAKNATWNGKKKNGPKRRRLSRLLLLWNQKVWLKFRRKDSASFGSAGAVSNSPRRTSSSLLKSFVFTGLETGSG